MSERPKPYVGVSGVVSPEQQRKIQEAAEPLYLVGRQLALGVKAVRKTQWLDTENTYGPSWYPVGDTIVNTLGTEWSQELRVAQIYLDHVAAIRAKEQDYERAFVDKLMGRAGRMLNALQFDMLPWDTRAYTDLFLHIKQTYPDTAIILQAHKQQMQQHGPQELARRLKWYPGQVDYVLFDASHGTGQRMDTGALLPFVTEAYRCTSLGIGVAGGLNAEVVTEDMPRLLEIYPDLSFDAEGQLHKNQNPEDRALNMDSTVSYLAAAAEVVGRVNRP